MDLKKHFKEMAKAREGEFYPFAGKFNRYVIEHDGGVTISDIQTDERVAISQEEFCLLVQNYMTEFQLKPGMEQSMTRMMEKGKPDSYVWSANSILEPMIGFTEDQQRP